MKRQYSIIDQCIIEIEQGITTLLGQVRAKRPNPAHDIPEASLSDQEKKRSRGLMRVDHAGEVCAQALYRGQALVSRSTKTKKLLANACEEEKDHLAWTHQRLQELNTHRSYLNTYWYAQSFLIGIIAGALGDHWSLSFLEETEKQVGHHLIQHEKALPLKDKRSRKIIQQMQKDEKHHEESAANANTTKLPRLIKKTMTLQSKIMTTIAYYF